VINLYFVSYLGKRFVKERQISSKMDFAKGTPITTELVQDLFKLDSNDTKICERARLFLEATIEAINDLRYMGTCGDTSQVSWPSLLRDFTEDGGFKVFIEDGGFEV
jgi:hypothetical protein